MPSFVSVLKSIGRGIGFAVGLVNSLPAGSRPVLVAGDLLNKVGQAVALAERSAELWGSAVTGQQKLALASQFAVDAVMTSELLLNREIANNEKFQRGVSALTSGIADILDSLKDK